MDEHEHIPVLLKETLRLWHGREGGFYVDGTAGAGGHAQALLQLDPRAGCMALDRDPQAVARARRRLQKFGERVSVLEANFSALPQLLAGRPRPDGVLLDLGVSSPQLEDPARGFSFQRPGPLDMRMGPDAAAAALDLLQALPAEELARVLKDFGEERLAWPIASALKSQLARGGGMDTLRCAEVVADVYRRKGARRGKIHPATRTFQALRIAVNRELDHLQKALAAIPDLLAVGGRAVIISFQSLEDRMVKRAFRAWSSGCVCPPDLPRCACGKTGAFRVLTRKPLRPGEEEAAANPRSRSAKLRAAEKI